MLSALAVPGALGHLSSLPPPCAVSTLITPVFPGACTVVLVAPGASSYEL